MMSRVAANEYQWSDDLHVGLICDVLIPSFGRSEVKRKHLPREGKSKGRKERTPLEGTPSKYDECAIDSKLLYRRMYQMNDAAVK